MPSQRRPERRGGRRSSGRASSTTPRSTSAPRELTPTLEPPDIATFREWEGLGEDIHAALEAVGITTPTPIQRLSIGPVLEGRDVIAKAETGTGKTLGFGAPMMAKVDPERATVLGLVLCPTRELAQQVADVIKMLGEARGIKVALVVGGDPMHPQIKELQEGAQIVVGTPGRVLDLANQRFLSFPWLEFAVLDEADKMFEIGFADDVKKILAMTPDERQTLMFSATFPPEVLSLARTSTKDPVEVATARGPSTVGSIEQKWVKVDEDQKALTLLRMFEDGDADDVYLVFCERRTDVDQLMRRLERSRFGIKALHGGYDQAARFRVMSAFRTGEIKALIATDVASRGLDVELVTHVVNYSVPRELEDYTHRIGRTGRAGRKGTAITFVVQREFKKWEEMIGRTDWDVEEYEPRRTHSRRSSGGERPRRGDRERGTEPRRSEERSRREERPGQAERSGQAERPARQPERQPRAERPRRAEHEEAARSEAPRSEAPRSEPRRKERQQAEPPSKEAAPFGFLPTPDPATEPADGPKRTERTERPRRPRREADSPAKPASPRSPQAADDDGFGAGI